jgi:hypothetical protein
MGSPFQERKIRLAVQLSVSEMRPSVMAIAGHEQSGAVRLFTLWCHDVAVLQSVIEVKNSIEKGLQVPP